MSSEAQDFRPRRIVMDVASHLANIPDYVPWYDKVDMLGQVLDLFLQDNGLRSNLSGVPLINPTRLSSVPKQASQADLEMLQNWFADLYVGILYEFNKFGIQRLVDEEGSFDYGMERLEPPGRLVMIRLRSNTGVVLPFRQSHFN